MLSTKIIIIIHFLSLKLIHGVPPSISLRRPIAPKRTPAPSPKTYDPTDAQFSYSGTPKAPLMSFHLGDGNFQTVQLKQLDLLKLSENEVLCHYIGKVSYDDSITIGVTGCPGEPHAQVTLISKAVTAQYMLDELSNISQVIPSPWTEGLARGAVVFKNDSANDEIFLDKVEKMAIEASIQCSEDCSIPPHHKMTIKIGYDNSLKEKVKNVLIWISGVMTHTQAFLYDSSLPTKIDIEVIGSAKHYPQDRWRAESSIKRVSQIARGDTDTDLYVFLCADSKMSGTVGVGYVGGLCNTNGFQVSINEWRQTEAETAKVVAHEMGHNMGMSHDFDKSHSGKECTGIMDYGNTPDTWSSCSQSDFKNHYFGITLSGKKHCLEVINEEPNPLVCKESKYIGDGYCDDVNNNEACQFDGGDCCNNKNKLWDLYCSACKCLDKANKQCQSPEYVGDRFCDDGNNNADCDFDGGDCCDHSFKLWNRYCKECECKRP